MKPPALQRVPPNRPHAVTLWVARDLEMSDIPAYTLWPVRPTFHVHEGVPYYAADGHPAVEIDHDVVVALGIGLRRGETQEVVITVTPHEKYAPVSPPTRRKRR